MTSNTKLKTCTKVEAKKMNCASSVCLFLPLCTWLKRFRTVSNGTGTTEMEQALYVKSRK